MHDTLDHLLWGLLVRGQTAWRLRGLLEEYVGVMEHLEHHEEIVWEIRRRERWRPTEE